MTKPNFFLVGAQRSGTTTLYRCLMQHSQVFMPAIKEPTFFATRAAKELVRLTLDVNERAIGDLHEYLALFEEGRAVQLVGEASVSYFHIPGVSDAIYQFNPEARIIAILRDPVERAYSQFVHSRLRGREKLEDFQEAVEADQEKIRREQPAEYYIERGLYFRCLRPYFERFGREKVQILLFDRLCADPGGLLMELFRFLGIDANVSIDVPDKAMASGVPKNRLVHWLLHRPSSLRAQVLQAVRYMPSFAYRILHGISVSNLSKPPLGAEVRRKMARQFDEDLLQLKQSYGIDVPMTSDGGHNSGAGVTTVPVGDTVGATKT